MKLPKIFLTVIFTLLLQLTAVGQNLVINPGLHDVINDSIECLHRSLFHINSWRNLQGWRDIQSIYLRRIDSPCVVNDYTNGASSIGTFNYTKAAQPFVGERAFYIMQDLREFNNLEEYRKSKNSLQTSCIIGAQKANLVAGKAYFFSVWLSTSYVFYNPLGITGLNYRSHTTADFGLMALQQKDIDQIDSIIAYNGFLPDSSVLDVITADKNKVLAINPPYNMIDFNADSNWVELRMLFRAKGASNYFLFGLLPNVLNRGRTIGGFNPFLATANEDVDSLYPNSEIAYFADAFSLLPYPELGDTLYVNMGDSLLLDPQTPDADLQWFDGSSQSTKTIYCPGLYWVESKSEFTQIRDYVWVLPKNPWPSDTTLCVPNATLNISPKASNIKWSTNEAISEIAINQEDSYQVVFTMPGGCSYKLSTYVHLDTLQLPYLLKDTTVCDSISIQISKQNQQQYQWSNGDSSQQFEVKNTGTYYLQVSNANCQQKLDFTVNIEEKARLNYADTLLCMGDAFTIEEDIINTWPLQSGLGQSYTDSADVPIIWQQKACGLQHDTLKIRFKGCECISYIANAISPNGDGLNDAFKPELSCETSDYQMQIYNRWGQIIFSTTATTAAWQPKDVMVGTYYYTLYYQNKENRKRHYHNGVVYVVD